jgi:hypothetical protein
MIFTLRLWPLNVLAIFVSLQSCTRPKPVTPLKPVRAEESWRGDNYAQQRYKANELLILYKGIPTQARRDTIRRALESAGVNPDSITIRTCNSCNSYVELWQGRNIHTVISGEGIVAGTVSGGSRGVGEDTTAIYSLNYLQYLPVEPLPTIRQYKFEQLPEAIPGTGRDTVIVAILDTGVDTVNVVKGRYLWRNKKETTAVGDADSNCYASDVHGWNFVNNSSDVRDDNLSLHGTIISQYIVNEFGKSPRNFVQLMNLKTHDNVGRGDLFSAICALHYAIDEGANIINASWGFYFYEDTPHPYLDSLITKVLPQKGILFVTAAGNKIDPIDQYAKVVYQNLYGITLPDSMLRNLEIHNFYPAVLSTEINNVIVATTTDGNQISPTQNHSDKYVDIGVAADTVNSTSMKFQVPFTTPSVFISGSSFATAILTGKIGAFTSKSKFTTGLKKQEIIDDLEAVAATISTSATLENRKYIRKGRYIKRE